VLAAAGLLVAISALWMTLFYQAQPGAGDLLYWRARQDSNPRPAA